MEHTGLEPLKRRAVIIGGFDHKKIEPTDGVWADVHAWREYLTSSEGGGWRDREIADVVSGNRTDVVQAIVNAGDADFSLVCFSGHGYLTKDRYGFNETMLILRDGVEISERTINTRTDRCMLIMDCCRRYEPSPVPTFDSAMESFSARQPVDTRLVYDNAIRQAEKGCVRVYSTDENEEAEDERSFTRMLIATAMEEIASRRGPVLKIDEAVALTSPRLAPQQNPVYNGGRRLGHFPFAVKTTSSI